MLPQAQTAPPPIAEAATYHTRTWLLWLVAAGLGALLTRNPLYLVLVVLAARAVDAAVAGRAAAAEPAGDLRRHGWSYFVRAGLVLAAFSAVFNGLGAHLGATVLFRLPASWPIVGGPLTLEGFAYGALAGFAILAVLLVAATFNTSADTYALLRAIPPFLAQVGLVTAIALAYVPQTVVRLREIYEAQQLRGHRFRGLRSLLPLVVPLLAAGLERALQLAEAMEARGFARRRPAEGTGARGGDVRLLLVLGTGGIAVGAFGLLYYRDAPGWGVAGLVLGLAAIALALRRLAGLTHQTRYRRQIWRPRDTVVSAALLVSLALTAGTAIARPGWWLYVPYPALAWPAFEPLIGLALLLLAAPALPLLWRQA